jgi:YD repeat-containing protein
MRDGTISRYAGTGASGRGGSGGPPLQASLSFPQDVAVAPDGAVFIADGANRVVRRVAPGLPGFTDADYSIPSADGREIYQFGPTGRHLRKVNAVTGATKLSFAYDAAGRLTSVTDVDGLVAQIQRDGSGKPQAVVAPGGQATALALDADGLL